ncbi:hypothetical protein E2C01_065820 [Portunus trituberculatus]|uniref:Uncharacterized protein n=1 Tax=Portunus trituberculatus TaxID=210409 RepID=A0A5B7HJX0_PORTR|nr:hypothetical protein [Portunus trituberculatus]
MPKGLKFANSPLLADAPVPANSNVQSSLWLSLAHSVAEIATVPQTPANSTLLAEIGRYQFPASNVPNDSNGPIQHSLYIHQMLLLHVVAVTGVCSEYSAPVVGVRCAAMGKKRKNMDEEDEGESSHRQTVPTHVKNQEKRLIVVLERANLESVKVGTGH